jgi:hypothetical protein
MEIAGADPEWAVGFEDECWWSRVSLPALNSWAEEGKPLRLIQRSVAKDDPEPKAVSCYGLYLPEIGETWLRFVDGRPVSSVTTRFLSWCCEGLEALGKKVLLLVWENASWHISRGRSGAGSVPTTDASQAGRPGREDRELPFAQAEPMAECHRAQVGACAKRKVVEPDGLLGAHELAERVCRVFGCPHHEHFSVTQNVA